MIGDSLMMHLLFMLLILMINIIGYTKIPFVSFIGLIGTFIIAIPTLSAFGEYYLFATILIILNMMIPIISLTNARKGD